METLTNEEIAKDIAQRLSLRAPQADSLEILHKVMATGLVKKNGDTKAQLKAVQAICPGVTGFDREFLSLCFALATGVGKTRLMGAIISYLYRAYGYKNFVVIAPNLTIYDKLVTDFTAGAPKYVFKGIEAFATTKPRIVTGENYQNSGAQVSDLLGGAVINIFNIAKLTAKDKGHLAAGDEKSKVAKIRRISETIGESYFEYLAGCDDLVVLMDESHRYRAEAGASAINELKPVLGVELTATPRVIKGTKEISFCNIAYEYNLAAAMTDGFVKEPAVATRKGFVASNYKADSPELEHLKLNDGAHLHELTRAALVNYAQNHNRSVVKPFMLVVAEDKKHADQLEAYMASSDFRKGYYADKIVKVYSGMSAEEDAKMVGQLLEIEKPGNKIEIVIHVNKLSEGWDVTNLYTIVPLRAANSVNLVEQSIGRGLRLPYGERTGDEAVDTLTIVSHDNYSKIIEASKAKKLMMFKSYVIGENVSAKGQKAVEVVPAVNAVIAAATQGGPKAAANVYIPASADVTAKELTPEFGQAMAAIKEIVDTRIGEHKACDLTDKKTVADILKGVQEKQKDSGATPSTKAVVEKACKVMAAMSISIPKIIPVSKGSILQGYEKFALDVTDIPTNLVDDKIKKTALMTEQTTFVKDEADAEAVNWMQVLMGKMQSFDEIDYDTNAEQIAALVQEALDYVEKKCGKDAVPNIMRNYCGTIAEIIRAQLKAHATYQDAGYDFKVTPGCVGLALSSALIGETEKIRDFNAPIAPGEKSKIKSMVFTGFKKCLYDRQKFDSDPERMFATILEKSDDVVSWFKPSLSGFSIAFKGHNYFPDFVIEAKDCKYLCEVKAADKANDPDVVEKAQMGVLWCSEASKEAAKSKTKGWKYLFIVDSSIDNALDFDVAAQKFVRTK